MRILHTSDWHLGRTFHRESLLSEQEAVVDRLVELASDQAVDLVVIAGDLYDRALPPAEAVALFEDAVGRLRGTGATVVGIAGNHDSHIRVGLFDRLLSTLGVTLRGDLTRGDEPVLVTPRSGGAPVAVYPLPYLDPVLAGPQLVEADAAGAIDGADGPDGAGSRRRLTHDAVTRLACDRIRADLAGRPAGTRSVLVAHTFAAGGATTESERDLSVGNIEVVGLDAFAGFDYVALGHLHGSQAFADGRIAYSGTPLPYSYSEEHQTKSVRIVELADDGTPGTEVVPLGVGQALATVRGPIDELLTSPEFDDAVDKRLRVFLTDRDLPLQAMDRLRTRFPTIAELKHEPPAGTGTAGVGSATGGETRSPIELLDEFWADQAKRPLDPDERAILESALAATHGSDA